MVTFVLPAIYSLHKSLIFDWPNTTGHMELFTQDVICKLFYLICKFIESERLKLNLTIVSAHLNSHS